MNSFDKDFLWPGTGITKANQTVSKSSQSSEENILANKINNRGVKYASQGMHSFQRGLPNWGNTTGSAGLWFTQIHRAILDLISQETRGCFEGI